jgi:hypothetical protein
MVDEKGFPDEMVQRGWNTTQRQSKDLGAMIQRFSAGAKGRGQGTRGGRGGESSLAGYVEGYALRRGQLPLRLRSVSGCKDGVFLA